MRSDIDLTTGIKEVFTKDGDTIRINKSQDIQPFVDANAQDRQMRNGNWQGDWHKVASIPPIVIEMWVQELKDQGYPNTWPLARENHDWFMAKLNNSDFLKLRTKEGKI